MSSAAIPTPLQTAQAVFKGYLPRLLQARGWVLAGLSLVPVGIILLVVMVLKLQGERIPPGIAVDVFHKLLAQYFLPIMALVAAPAGIREDIEQRTIPLMLARPTTIWALPFGKGLIWYAWGVLWLAVACLGLVAIGGGLEELPRMVGALAAAYWAELAFLTLLGLVFKRGALWGALYLFIWDRAIWILPGNLQRLTFAHYVENIAGSKSGVVNTAHMLAQTQIATPALVAALVLLLAGAAFWILSGWKLQATPIGLAGAEAEG
jgi:ABC-type transport system involved in multi-copper enzyme maturation permease subunit